jgi:hypothetical protein
MESRREKIRATLLVFLIAVSTRPARWYRLRTEDVNDKYSLSFLCGVPPLELDDILLRGDFVFAYGKTLRVKEMELSHFLEASVVKTELEQSRVDGKKEYFVRIGTFGSSKSFTAIDQFASGMIPLQCPREAGRSFRQSLNEPSETTGGSTGETTETTTEPHTEETTEGTTGETTENITKPRTEEITDGTTEESG